MILHSSLYNLNNICPNLTLYETAYFKLVEKTYTFNLELKSLDFKMIEGDFRLPSFSNFLVYNILINFFKNNVAVKKDIEDYYNTQILSFLRVTKQLNQFSLKDLAVSWNSLNKTLDFFIKDLQQYDSFINNYNVYWTDSKYNYYETIPVIAVKDNEIILYFILQYNSTDYILTGDHIDYLKTPSMRRVLYNISENFIIKDIKILWLDISNLNTKFKLIVYNYNKEIDTYIKETSNLQNFKINSKHYSDFKICHICPFNLDCASNNRFYKKNRIKEHKNHLKSEQILIKNL